MEIVLGVGALGAALVGGGSWASYWLWRKHKKSDLNSYDAILFLNYKHIFDKSISAPNEEVISWKYAESAFLEEDQSALTVCIVGDYNQGKTFVLNGIAGAHLDSQHQVRTQGISFKKATINTTYRTSLDVIFLDTEGSNCLPEDPNDLDLMVKRQNYDLFIHELACRLSDITILVTDRPTSSLMHQLADLCGIIKSRNASRTIVVVYNNKSIDSKEDLTRLFTKEVVEKFRCQKFEGPSSTISYYYSTLTTKGDIFKVVHLPLGKEGSESGKHYNRITFESIRYLIEQERSRKEECGENSMLKISSAVFAQASLFKRYLGISLQPKDLSTSEAPLQINS
jgi:GTPase SAR1 family protein